jgi:hypothetical protein
MPMSVASGTAATHHPGLRDRAAALVRADVEQLLSAAGGAQHAQAVSPVGLASWYQQASAGSGAQPLFSLVMTGAWVSIIPVTIAFLFLQRFWQDGLTTGSVK